jgi:hypothetical protein
VARFGQARVEAPASAGKIPQLREFFDAREAMDVGYCSGRKRQLRIGRNDAGRLRIEAINAVKSARGVA